MSMRNNVVDDYGLVFNGNHLQILASQLVDDYIEDDYDENRYEYYDVIVDKLGLEYISEFTGETMCVNNDGSSQWDSTDLYQSDSIYYLGLSKYPTLFKITYNSMDEIINELKLRIGKYLPDNFPYRNCFRHVIGTYFG